MGYTEKAVVIGAGISGLACAFRLKQGGVLPVVLEASDHPGGVITTARRNGFLFEAGPQCPRFPSSVWSLLRELDLEGEFVAGDRKAKRYILRDGQLHRAPFSPVGLLTTGLLSWSAKGRIFAEVFGSTLPPANEESLAAFVQRKFGSEILENLVDPLISTIFFGDSHKMGMEAAFPTLVEWERNHGSLVRGGLHALRSKSKKRISQDLASSDSIEANRASLRVTDSLPSLGSLRSGMGALPRALANELRAEIRYGVSVESVQPLSTGGSLQRGNWQIGLSNGENIEAQHVVFAVPAYVAAKLLGDSVPQLAKHFGAIEYAPIRVVCSCYRRSDVRHSLDGFGFMVPRGEGLHTICTFWNSSLFPGRAPDGKVLVTSFAAWGLNGDEGDIGEEDCARIVEAENARVLGVSGAAEDHMVWRNRQALPQYNVGHARLVAEIRAVLGELAGLHVIGNFLNGRSIGDCVDAAFHAAQEVHSLIRGANIERVRAV